MYVLAKDITKDCRTIPAGTRLSSIYEMPPGGEYVAFAHIWGERIKLTLLKADLAIGKPNI